MKTKVLAVAALSILLTTPVYAYQDVNESNPSESTEEFNARLKGPHIPTLAEQYQLQKAQFMEFHKMRCLLEKINGQEISQDCQISQQLQDGE
jgi:hypothetical protein